MALNKEIWINSIVENFIPDDSFLTRSVDHSLYVNDHTVHVPQAGSAPTITKNRSSFPATISERTDSELTYNLDKYDVEPLLVRGLDTVELSYDKRTSMLRQSKATLLEYVSMDTLKKWVPSGVQTVKTSGASEAAHAPSATGNRKAMTRADVMSIKRIFDTDNVPSEGRTILLDAIMYNQLVNSMTDAENVNFLAGADPTRGVMGKFLGFDFMMRSSVLTTAAGGTLKTGSAAATDCSAGFAWHRDSVCRALGEVQVFNEEKSPTYYADIFSFAMRAGGSVLRSDKKGIVLLYQDTVS